MKVESDASPHSVEKQNCRMEISEENGAATNSPVLMKICFDVIAFVVVAVPVLGRYIYDAIPARRGFFCNDDTIVYPFKEDTITDSILYNVGFSFPTVLIFLNELHEAYKRARKRLQISYRVFSFDLAWNLYARIGTFLFGAFINEIVTNVSKIIIGRLRPCFLDACKPNIDCSSASFPYTYITNYTCLAVEKTRIQDSRKSFPSGHSTFAFYTLLFLVMYFQYCVTWKGPKLLKPSLQITFLTIAWCTALSRIYDNKHHWSDVTIGTILGCIIAMGTVYFISDFSPKSRKASDEPEDASSTVREGNISLQAIVSGDYKVNND